MEKIPELYDAVITFALSRGAQNIKELPGCWEADIDEHWWVAVNGHRTEMECSKGIPVEPFSMYLEFNGWPAGVLDARGGALAAGAVANEDSLLAALRVKAVV